METGIGGISALIRGGTERALIGTAPREFFCGNSILLRYRERKRLAWCNLGRAMDIGEEKEEKDRSSYLLY